MLLQPVEHLARMLVRRKDREEDVLDALAVNDQGQTLVEAPAIRLEDGQAQGFAKGEARIRQQGIRETQPQRQLTLIARFLDRQSVNLLETGVQQIAEAVPKTASFRRASTGSWDLIPTHRHVFARNTGGGIDEEDPAFITYRSQVHVPAISRTQRNVGEAQAAKMVRAAVVGRRWEVFGEPVAERRDRGTLPVL